MGLGNFGSFAGPTDVMFYSWHSTVDMLLYIWHKCHVEDPITSSKALTNAMAFTQGECRKTTAAMQVLDEVTVDGKIYMRADGSDVRDHPVLGRFFEDIGEYYSDYADARAMGDYAFEYALPGEFDRILLDEAQCPASGTTEGFTNTTEPDNSDGLSYWEWYDQTKANLELTFPNDPDEVSRQLEYLECLGFDEKFGIQNFTADVIDDFFDGQKIEPRCQEIIEGFQEGELEVDEGDAAGEWGNIGSEDSDSSTAATINTSFLLTIAASMILVLLDFF